MGNIGNRSESVMPKSVKELYEEASTLDEKQRADLAGLLLESLDSERDPDVERAWAIEIEQRVAQIEAGEVEMIPWEDIKRDMYARINSTLP
jgi:putative addiction module component (TIGR02574 family)